MLKLNKKIIAIALCSILASCGNYQKLPEESWNYEVQKLNLKALSESQNDVFNKALPSFVCVLNIFEGEYSGLGSGFIFDQDDEYQYIITNAHVLPDETEFYVLSYMGQIVKATFIGKDENADVGVIKCKILEGTKTATFPNDDYRQIENPAIGSVVYAIGSPGSLDFAQTITKGIVNGVDRFPLRWEEKFETANFAIQVNLTLNPGNSGGPLLNENGEVIGVSTFGVTIIGGKEATGANFCLPINSVLRMAEVIKEEGLFIRPSLGINQYKEVKELTLYERNYLKLNNDFMSGVVITKHGSDSLLKIPLYSIIKSINGYEIPSLAEFRRRLYETNPGDEVELEYLEYSKNGYKDAVKIKVKTASLKL